MSYSQERVWVSLHALDRTADGQVIPLNDRLYGPLDIDRLRDCLSYIVGRHEILRTTFGVKEGQPVQLIHPAEPVDLPVFDLTGLDDAEERAREIITLETSRVADVVAGPLIRFSVIRFDRDRHRLLRPVHHIIWDRGSTRILLRELAALYQAKLDGRRIPLPEVARFQFADYAVRERRAVVENPAFRNDITWWRRRLERKRLFRWGSKRPLPNLPFARVVPEPSARIEDSRAELAVDADLVGALEQMRRRAGVTTYVIWLAAIVALVGHEGASRDVVVGTYVTTRRRAEMRSLIGFCSNLVTLGFRCDFARTFSEWTAIVGDESAEVDSRSYIPYEKLRQELSALRAPMVPIGLIFDAPLGFACEDLHFGGLTLSDGVKQRSKAMPWGCSVTLHGGDDRQIIQAKFDARSHDPAGVNGFLRRLLALLRRASHEPDARLSTILRQTAHDR